MRVKILAALFFFVLSCATANAQRTASNPLGGNISVQDAGTCSTTGSFLWQTLPFNAGTTTLNLSGTFSATVTVRESNNGGTTWSTAATLTSTGTTTYSTNGFTDFCVDVTTYASGTVALSIMTGQLQILGVTSPSGSQGFLCGNGCVVQATGSGVIAARLSQQVFTGNGTFTIPTGVTALKVTVTGGGGAGGGGTATANTSGSGGGSGATAIVWLSGLTSGNTIGVTIGPGGTGVSGASGNPGTSSSIQSGSQTITTVTATGGGAGGSGTSAGGGGGTASNGTINLGGSPGTLELVSFSNGTGQNGGPSFWGGAGGGAAAGANTGVAGGAPGAGGGGGGGGTSNTAGGAGAAGIVVFEWNQ